MSHTVFQTSQIMPMNTQIIPSSKTLLPPLLRHPVRSFKVSKVSVIKATASPAVDGDPVAFLEHCFQDSPAIDYQASSSSTMFAPVMKGEKYGAFGAVTLEKAKLDMSQQKQTKSSPEIATGGGGGNMGKNLNHGGGDGGDDDGDDDDYFDDFDDGDEGDEGGLFRRRMILQELFDRKFVDAVLNEWQKTMMDLPSGFRQAYEMGLVSSAQMVKFLSYNARPTVDRFISRLLPEGLSRAFNGRKIADPAFLHKLLLDQATTIGCSVWWEVKNRKERIKQEWDLALLNVLTATACNAAVFWTLAPCHSYGNTFRYDLQNTLQKLPNNIFEKSYPLREFDLQKRIHSFFYKAAELCMLGLSAGAVQGALSNLLASKKEGRLSVSIPSVSNNALGYGAFLGVYANLRYQLLNGFDRAVFNYFDVIGVAVVFSTAMRVLNVQVGETSRLAWLGMEVDPLAHSDDVLKAYSRPTEGGLDQSSSKWFISKNPIVSGLGLLGIKQGQSDSTTTGAKLSECTNITIINYCKETVWPGITPKNNFRGDGFQLKQGQSAVFTAPAGWSGRIWGRTGCDFDKNDNGTCQTGRCGTGLKCTEPGQPPASIAEFTLGDTDFYDVSLVDGFNLPIVVKPVNGKGNCSSVGCDSDLRPTCPSELALKSDGKTIACRSACNVFDTDEYCCRGTFSSPVSCLPTNYSRIFKTACPLAYSFAFDDPTSIITCSSTDYVVSFCSSRNQTQCTNNGKNVTCSEAYGLKSLLITRRILMVGLTIMISLGGVMF